MGASLSSASVEVNNVETQSQREGDRNSEREREREGGREGGRERERETECTKEIPTRASGALLAVLLNLVLFRHRSGFMGGHLAASCVPFRSRMIQMMQASVTRCQHGQSHPTLRSHPLISAFHYSLQQAGAFGS